MHTNPLPCHTHRAPDGGFLKDDGLTIKTAITVKPPVGDWYDSKARTGYVGLKNQGATCYLNSWLQTLFHINYFRKVPPPPRLRPPLGLLVGSNLHPAGMSVYGGALCAAAVS